MLLTVAVLAPAVILWAADDTDDVQQLATVLQSPTSNTVQQEEAARRLLQRSGAQANQVLQDALKTGTPAMQIAVARALGYQANPDPAFIPLLEPLLGPSPAVTREAARALVNYPNQPAIFDVLKTAATNSRLPQASRAQVVRAMGTVMEKQSAEFLISLLDASSEAMQNAAVDALVEMTGLRENGQDHTRWQKWWAGNSSKPADQWRSDLIAGRTKELLQTRQRYLDLVDELQDVLAGQYGMIGDPAAKKSDAILRYLQSPAPDVREDGIQLVYKDFTNDHPVSDDVRKQLRSMIGDSDRNVRLQVALDLKAINDLDAAPALIAQLGQEPDAMVRLYIAQALGESGDVRAAPVLVQMLKDPVIADAAAAAMALSGEIGEKLRHDPDRATQVRQTVDALQNTLDTRTGNDPADDDLRAGCVEALATLSDPRSEQTFQQLLSRPNESANVRKAALRGLGNLSDPRTTSLIANSLADAKPDVRLEAARALRNLATFAQAEQLYQMVNAQNEGDARVRDAVWSDLRTVLHKGTAAELNDWQDRFKDDPEKQLEVLQALHDALAKTNDKKQLAISDQNIGEILLSNLNRPQEAIDHFQAALDYWQNGNQGEPARLPALVDDMMNARLKARQYADAAKFAAQEIKSNPSYQPVVGARIKIEADRLRTSGDKDGALQLIDAALKMPKESALDEKHQDDLRDIQSKINQPGPGGP
jgi:HEAT repeat protein